MSDEIKLLAIENEGAMGRDTIRQTKNVHRYSNSVFIKTYFRQIKILQKIKKLIRPTYPNCKKHVTGNTHIFLFGLTGILQVRSNQKILKSARRIIDTMNASLPPFYSNVAHIFVWNIRRLQTVAIFFSCPTPRAWLWSLLFLK